MSDDELAILRFERNRPSMTAGQRMVAARELGMSSVRYTQRLNALLDRQDALEHDPMTVNRLRRVRDARSVGRRRSRAQSS